MTPESKVKEKIKAILKERGAYYCMPRGTAIGRSGIPDFLCCYRGFFFGIEAKAGKNTPTALQEQEIQAIRDAGGLAAVINESNISAVRDLLRSIDAVVDAYVTEIER